MDIANKNGQEVIELVRSEYPYGVDTVIEAVGKEEVWQTCLSLVRAGGLINYFGGCPKTSNISLDTYRVHYEELRIMGVFHHTPQYMKKAFELIHEGEISMLDLISETFELKDLEQALLRHQSGKVFKTLIQI